MEELLSYFPNLQAGQIEQFRQLGSLYQEWNEKINVISRKDIDNLYTHHILHSLAIAKVVSFHPKARVLDLGTGGGFPGIPLAIMFPETQFALIDGTRKKITVVEEVAAGIGLQNVTARHIRVEDFKGNFDFVVSRAVARLDKLVHWSFRLIRDKQQHSLPNGLLTLKGGDMKEEIKSLGRGSYTEVFPLTDFFDLPYFEEKCLVYVQW
jgi:16S rRNA (guanine527-N7)-methyltransferase